MPHACSDRTQLTLASPRRVHTHSSLSPNSFCGALPPTFLTVVTLLDQTQPCGSGMCADIYWGHVASSFSACASPPPTPSPPAPPPRPPLPPSPRTPARSPSATLYISTTASLVGYTAATFGTLQAAQFSAAMARTLNVSPADNLISSSRVSQTRPRQRGGTCLFHLWWCPSLSPPPRQHRLPSLRRL